jgi:lipoprotein NlpI
VTDSRPRPELATVAALERQRDFARAERILSTAIGADESAAQLYEQRGIVRDDRGHFDEAAADFTQAIARASQPGEVSRYYAERAFSYWLARDWRPALRDYGAAVSADNHNSSAYLGRGRSELFAGRLDESITDLQKALSLKKDAYAALWLYIAEAHAGKNARADVAARTAGWDLAEWPGPLVRTFRSDQTAASTVSAPPPQPKDAQERCLQEFYLGELALAGDDRRAALMHFQNAQRTGLPDQVEFVAAGLELSRLQH